MLCPKMSFEKMTFHRNARTLRCFTIFYRDELTTIIHDQLECPCQDNASPRKGPFQDLDDHAVCESVEHGATSLAFYSLPIGRPSFHRVKGHIRKLSVLSGH